MKKRLFFLFILVCVTATTLCGCTSSQKVKIQKHFSSKVYISTEYISFKGDFSHSENGDIILVVNSPEEISGYKYSVNSKKVKMSFMDIHSTCNISDLPQKAPIRVLNRCFSDVEAQEDIVNFLGDKDSNHTIKSGNSQITINRKGEIIGIKTEDMEFAFTNHRAK